MKTWKLTESRARAGWHTLIGPYDAAFVRALKAAVDRKDREWDDIGKFWRVRSTVVEVAQRVINEFAGMVAP